jgi:hypothetical protein
MFRRVTPNRHVRDFPSHRQFGEFDVFFQQPTQQLRNGRSRIELRYTLPHTQNIDSGKCLKRW